MKLTKHDIKHDKRGDPKVNWWIFKSSYYIVTSSIPYIYHENLSRYILNSTKIGGIDNLNILIMEEISSRKLITIERHLYFNGKVR